MESKERYVEAWTAVLLIDVNDYLSRDDLPFLLLCSLASSQHAEPEVLEWAPPGLFLSFFADSSCDVRLQQISREGFVKHCQTALSSQGRFTCVIVLRNTLSDNQEFDMFVFSSLLAEPSHYMAQVYMLSFSLKKPGLLYTSWVLLLF